MELIRPCLYLSFRNLSFHRLITSVQLLSLSLSALLLGQMKLFTWVQSKLSGGKKPTSNAISPDYLHTPQEHCKEIRKDEYGDWPNGLLTIGTFGNGDQSKDQARKDQRDHTTPSPSQDQSPQDLTIEQLWRLQQELNSFLNMQPQQCDPPSDAMGNSGSSGLYRSASCPFRSEIITDAREIAELISHEPNTGDDNFQETDRAVVSRKSRKDDVVSDGANRNGIGKRSLSLLMKMFACKSGFDLKLSTVPSFRDPLPETRMEKILRAVLRKKVYAQSSSQALSAKRCLEQRPMPKSSSNQEQANEEAAKSKWDRTNSEYIVLEI